MTEPEKKTEPDKKDEKTDKKRGSLSLTDLILFGLGNVVGAGIFIIISKSIIRQNSFNRTSIRKPRHPAYVLHAVKKTFGKCIHRIH